MLCSVSHVCAAADATAKVPSGLTRGNLRRAGGHDEPVVSVAQWRATAKCPSGHACRGQPLRARDQMDSALAVEGRGAHHHLARQGSGELEDAPGYTPEFSRWELGVCVPAACAAADVQALLSGVARRLLAGTSLRAHVRVLEQTCQTRGSNRRPLGAAHYAFVAFCGTFLVLVILGTIWNFHYDCKSPEDRSPGEAVLCAFSLCTGWKRLTSDRTEELAPSPACARSPRSS
ncbi:Uncharacterized protein GBIM_00633 [Gryllus bimaculatus]|nr:Uncharacterized protein GBIM_00633 [Gryllus bimaculatus]